MELKFRKPSKNTRQAVCRAALYHQEVDVESAITKITGHRYAHLLNSGNAAILLVASRIEGPFLVPDEGGWRGFKKIPALLKREVFEVKTREGLIEAGELESALSKTSATALFITSFAGYTAEQDVKELFRVCEEHGVLLVEDASGSVSDPTGRLCNGKHSHIIIASTGSPKTVNAGGGGFLSTSIPEIVQRDMLLSSLKPDPYLRAAVYAELGNAERNFTETVKACSYLKKKFENALHRDRRGLNVILPSDNPQRDVKILRKMITAEGRSVFTPCPLYDRTLSRAVAFEVKNIEVDCLTEERLDKMAELINKVL